MVDRAPSNVQIIQREWLGKTVFVVDSWSRCKTPFIHGFFPAELNVRHGCLEFNNLPFEGRRISLRLLKQVHGADWVELKTTPLGDGQESGKYQLAQDSSVDGVSPWLDNNGFEVDSDEQVRSTSAIDARSRNEFEKCVLIKDGSTYSYWHSSEDLLESSFDVNNAALSQKVIEADGWISTINILSELNLALGIATADCIPVIGFCKSSGCVFVLHCGWRSTVKDILPRVIKRVSMLGADLEKLEIAIGPGASFESYEVGDEVASQIRLAVSRCGRSMHAMLDFVRPSSQGKYLINLSALLTLQATTQGVPHVNIGMLTGCTIKDRSFFSYRRDGDVAGRQLSFVGPVEAMKIR